MEDAYLIGIRLALDNGVSAGVAAIRDELKALDGAIADSASNLRQLQALAAQTTAAGFIPPARLPALPAPPPVNAEVGPTTQPAPAVQQPDDNRPGLAPATQLSPVIPNAPGPSAQSTALTASRTPQPLSVDADISPASPVTQVPIVLAPPTPPPSTQPALAASPRPIDKPDRSPPPKAPVTPREPPERHSSAAPSPPAATSVAPTTVSEAAAQSPAPPPFANAARSDATPATRQSAAPQQLETRVQPLSGQPQAASAQHPIAPQTQTASATPTTGDVYLDGTRLGHWVASNLARQASRPPAGGTSFDPRLGISWPGAQQSGD